MNDSISALHPRISMMGTALALLTTACATPNLASTASPDRADGRPQCADGLVAHKSSCFPVAEGMLLSCLAEAKGGRTSETRRKHGQANVAVKSLVEAGVSGEALRTAEAIVSELDAANQAEVIKTCHDVYIKKIQLEQARTQEPPAETEPTESNEPSAVPLLGSYGRDHEPVRRARPLRAVAIASTSLASVGLGIGIGALIVRQRFNDFVGRTKRDINPSHESAFRGEGEVYRKDALTLSVATMAAAGAFATVAVVGFIVDAKKERSHSKPKVEARPYLTKLQSGLDIRVHF